MEPRITIITLGVRDFERSLQFYRDGLRLPVGDRYPDAVFFRLTGITLGLYPRALLAKDANVSAEGHGFEAIALAHNVRTRAEVERVLAEAEAAGGTVVQPPRVADWGGYSGYFADPDGHLWEVACTPAGSIE
ncbi:MAG TPA: VOC family protein [Candidatus Binatia bacterium]|nr:VOC family protein [Candidatus Binatia bacterium]